MSKIVINKNSNLAYIPKEMVEEGFSGEIELLREIHSVVLIRPGSTSDEVIDSLKHIINKIKRVEEVRRRENGEVKKEI